MEMIFNSKCYVFTEIPLDLITWGLMVWNSVETWACDVWSKSCNSIIGKSSITYQLYSKILSMVYVMLFCQQNMSGEQYVFAMFCKQAERVCDFRFSNIISSWLCTQNGLCGHYKTVLHQVFMKSITKTQVKTCCICIQCRT